MKERKNIDRLYQEKFRDLEATPREAVWKSISAKLQEKERRKSAVRPLWYRIAGVAAIISLLLLIGDWILQPQQVQVVSNEEQTLDNSTETILPNDTSIAASTPSEEEILSEDVEEITTKPVVSAKIQDKKTIVSETSSISLSGIRKTISSLTGLKNSVSNTTTEKEKSPEISEENAILEDLNKISQEEEIASSFDKRIEVKTHAAPIYYGNFGKGNFLDAQFDGNSSKGEVTYSYGINIAYAFSEKLKVRSGINKVSMSYNTNDIAYHSVVNPAAVSSINYRDQGNIGNTVIGSSSPRTKGDALPATANKASFGNLATGLLNQKIGYLEVPVELEYKLIDHKFQVNLIGGASTLFLDENMITVNSGSLSTDLGEANNLNNVSFSTNIGLGVDYNLTKQFKLNVEPMFKYQINTFSGTSGEAQPYYLGIYSGFSFEF
jgi:hypothetical protein